MAADHGFRNPALERMRAGDVALGLIVKLGRTADIARIAKTSGHDFIFIDGQHSIFDLETVNHLTQAAQGLGVSTVVRVKGALDQSMSLYLDFCASGIVVPDVNTPDDARRAVERCKFPPIGKRWASNSYPMFDYRPIPLNEQLRILNDNTMLVCMIETVEAVNNVEAIAAVDGVDVVHMGCNDLLVDMGKPGAFGDPEVAVALDRLIAACKANGKIAGVGGDRDVARQARYIQKGVRFMTTQVDIAMLIAEATRRTEALRKAMAAGGPG